MKPIGLISVWIMEIGSHFPLWLSLILLVLSKVPKHADYCVFLFFIIPSYLSENKYLSDNKRHCSIQQNGADSLLRQAPFSSRIRKIYLKVENH